MTYQETFNSTLKNLRMVCNATGNKALGDTIVKIMFDFSDELLSKDILRETQTNAEKKSPN